ncbi:Pantoate--beta-alanine ligase [Neolecta irregularis DAH-3]|uniref:Pantoate--beta-alanine ligase n=1 Tax=Neolecta irregularis (strain DAH-3) TaxID=1198029 RepID=A0A1U7LGA7_NEOID|nr:Pantoate--beta-alanine ligase [Neolecta irregularis DAH-3]|eukprot:OLL21679.1 Pantoate--beta-alanine ligase [Neolecta irregularis DAH-3]
MKVFKTIDQFRQWRRNEFLEARSVGFVPTMGALHAGHTGLIDHAKSENDSVVVSIFVNPAQFAPTEDFDSYPRSWETDKIKLQEKGKVDAVLLPLIAEMYPSGITLDVSQQQGTFVHVQGLSHQLEGKARPHFFRGVATVVSKLFNIVQPETAYFGQKDIQQTVVLKALVRDLLIPTTVRVFPTLREDDGLALSSRNAYLSPDQRKHANALWRGLSAARDVYLSHKDSSRDEILGAAQKIIDEVSQLTQCEVELEYISMASPETLLEVGKAVDGTILSGAMRIGKKGQLVTRIIDNLILES